MLLTIVKLLGACPIELRRCFGATLARVAYLFPSREKQIAKLQIERFLNSDGSKITKGLYLHLGKTVFECLNLKPLTSDKDQLNELEDDLLLNTVRNSKGGTLALSAHLGNWELLGAKTAALGLPITVIGKENSDSALQALVDKMRRDNGITTIWRAEQSGAKDVFRAFKSGSVVAALIDQDTRVSSQQVPFFGTPCKTPSAIIDLALRKNALIYSAFVVKDKGRYRAIIKSFDTTKSSAEILIEFNTRLEETIRKYPEQWVWFHKRWRTIEEGKTLSTKEYIKYLSNRNARN